MKSWKGLKLMFTEANNAPNITQCHECNASPAVLVQAKDGKPICLHCDANLRLKRGEYEWRQWLCEGCHLKPAVRYCKMHGLATCKVCGKACDPCREAKDKRITFALGAFKSSATAQVVSPRQAAACASLLGPVVVDDRNPEDKAHTWEPSFANMWAELSDDSPLCSNAEYLEDPSVQPGGRPSKYFNEVSGFPVRGSDESSRTEVNRTQESQRNADRDSSTPESQAWEQQNVLLQPAQNHDAHEGTRSYEQAPLMQAQESEDDCHRSKGSETTKDSNKRSDGKVMCHSPSKKQKSAAFDGLSSSLVGSVAGYNPCANRPEALQRYKDKKKKRQFNHKVMYVARMERAHNRSRVKGRFVKEEKEEQGVL